MVKNLAWIFSEVLIMLRSVKAQIQGLSKSQISSDKLVPVGSVGSGQVGWSGFSKDKVWLRLSQPKKIVTISGSVASAVY